MLLALLLRYFRVACFRVTSYWRRHYSRRQL